MKGFRKRLSALLVTAAMTAAVVVPAAADTRQYTKVNANDVTYNKILVLKDDATTPNVTFKYSVSVPASDIPATQTTLGVFKGVTATEASEVYPKVADVVYDETVAADTTPAITGLPTGYKTVTKGINIDFDKIAFPEPGVYRYYITEAKTPAIAGMKYDVTAAALTTEGNGVRTLDIYVEDSNAASSTAPSGTTTTGLKITGYVLYKGEVTAGPLPGSNATSGTAITSDVTINQNGIYVETGTDTGATKVSGAEKTNNIINFYGTNNLTFGKEVTGNQGSRDKYFKYTITAENDSTTGQPTVNASDKFTVDMSNATKEPTKTAATTYEASAMKTANNVTDVTGAQLIAGKVFYLQDGDYITILGLPQGFKYKVEEDKEDYTQTEKIAEDVSTLDWDAAHTGNDALNDNVSGAINNADIHTGFTNSKEGVIPTGVLLTMTPVIVVAVIVVAGIAFFAVRNAKRKALELADADSEEEAE